MGCGCRGGGRGKPAVSGPPRRPNVTTGSGLPARPSLAPPDAGFSDMSEERRRIEQLRREAIRNSLGVG